MINKIIKVKLRDITDYTNSNLSMSTISSNDKYPVYGADCSVVGYSNQYFADGFVAIVKDGSGVSNTFILREKANVLGTIGCIKSKNIDLNYLFYAMKTLNLNKFIIDGTIPHIYYKDFSIVELNIHESNEIQKKIGCFLISSHS